MSKKRATAARLTLTVPADLRRRMDKLPGEHNWSQIASQAFERYVGEQLKKQEKLVMDDVIARLRASKVESNDAAYKTGFGAGQRWAQRHAEAEDLERLERNQERSRDTWGEWGGLFDNDTMGGEDICHAQRAYDMLFGADAGTDNDATEFWRDIIHFDDDAAKQEYKGFLEGALDIWHKVKSEL